MTEQTKTLGQIMAENVASKVAKIKNELNNLIEVLKEEIRKEVMSGSTQISQPINMPNLDVMGSIEREACKRDFEGRLQDFGTIHGLIITFRDPSSRHGYILNVSPKM